MLPTQATLETLAERIEQAYRRVRPRWCGIAVSSRVWEMAAAGLYLLHSRNPSIPLDPELFVASQPMIGRWSDPWVELTPPRSLKRYVRRVRRIVRQLATELQVELRRAERRLIRGKALDSFIGSDFRSLSPLGCFVLAHRAGRDDLTERFRAGAQSQHIACPLYRVVCRSLLPDGMYPEPLLEDSPILEESDDLSVAYYSLN